MTIWRHAGVPMFEGLRESHCVFCTERVHGDLCFSRRLHEGSLTILYPLITTLQVESLCAYLQYEQYRMPAPLDPINYADRNNPIY
jgi:hypothetical protein